MGVIRYYFWVKSDFFFSDSYGFMILVQRCSCEPIIISQQTPPISMSSSNQNKALKPGSLWVCELPGRGRRAPVSIQHLTVVSADRCGVRDETWTNLTNPLCRKKTKAVFALLEPKLIPVILNKMFVCYTVFVCYASISWKRSWCS